VSTWNIGELRGCPVAMYLAACLQPGSNKKCFIGRAHSRAVIRNNLAKSRVVAQDARSLLKSFS